MRGERTALNPSEYESLQRSRNGDAEAFRMIVEGHQPFAYAVAFRFLGNVTDAEDAVQEAFINVWKHLAAYDPRKKFTTWLYRIVANECLDHIKSRKRLRTAIPVESMSGGADQDRAAGDDPNQAFDDRERLRMVEAFVRELPDKQRMVFILRDMQDQSIEETSQILKMSRASVKSNLCHARIFLRQRIEQIEKAGL
jgi:RNA polymerase sigma-70 factor, ECF subfamily